MEKIITFEGVNKTFKIAKRPKGVWGAFLSLFKREYVKPLKMSRLKLTRVILLAISAQTARASQPLSKL